ncbi:MAG TPA: transglutaminase family protein [Casimicrobiaceae bacterium]|nr:transglutaminase family protein [Casimicrobiaceae bacterium]
MPNASTRSQLQPGPEFLTSTRFLDCDSEAVRGFANAVTAGETTPIGQAIKLFYAVRDQWRYDPFSMRLTRDAYIASRVLQTTAAYCIPKAILLAAAARAVGIPAGIGLADVVNHLTTPKLRERLGGRDYFMHHGYAVLYLDGNWVKAAATFNRELCMRFGVRPTEFDGRTDALFQEFDAHDRRHMEYVKDHGMWSDFPFDMVMADFRAFYPPSAFADGSGERFEDGALQPRSDAE